VPGVQKAYRTAIYWARETLVPAFVVDARLAAPAKKAALFNINRAIKDPGLREKVTPTFQIGCKRILISNDWYPALTRQNVDLVTDAITKITAGAVVTQDGTERAIDVLIVATGFHTTDLPIAEHIHGRGGESLATHFKAHGMQAYKGATVHGFPNLFFIVGPNTGLGHSSMVFMIESQVAYAVDAVRKMRAGEVAAIEPTPQAQKAWNDALQRRMKRTVWSSGGCSSWYLDEHGRNVTLWPRTTYKFRQLTAEFDTENYQATARTDGASSTRGKISA
jgi:cation diffusion facilitator CzcD-associated flavoprotein CzcO